MWNHLTPSGSCTSAPCCLVAARPEGEVTYVPDDDVDQLWEDAIANDGAFTCLAHVWPWTDQVAWWPHCIVKQVSTDDTPAATSERRDPRSGTS